MDLLLSGYQNITLDRIQNSSKFRIRISDSKIFLLSSTGFLFSGTKWITPVSRIKCSVVEQNLRAKPKLTNIEVEVEEKIKSHETRIRKSSSGLCDQIERLVLHGKYQEALELFEIVLSEGDFVILYNSTYDALVSACIGSTSIRGVKKLINFMIGSGFKPDQYMSNRVLSMHVQCGMMIDARRLFDEMPERNIISWTTIISGLVNSGDYVNAFRFFFTMWSDTSFSGTRIFATMIRACAGIELIYPGKQLHACVAKMGFSGDVFVACGLIDMYSKSGSLEDARFLFDDMPDKTTVAWNTIIAAYALHGHSEEALGLYYEMQDLGVRMDHFTFSIVVRICARLGSLEHAKQAHAGVVRHGFGLDIVANTALVDLYSKWGRVEDARNVFDRMTKKNLISWNALVAGYGNHGRGEEAVKLFEQMLQEGMKPNHVTFLAVLSACSYSGLSDIGWEIFDSMSSEHGIKPRAMHYSCMIELLGREGLLDEALTLIRNLPFPPTVNMWAALLTASRVHKNLELGKFAAEKVNGMEPEKISSYIVLLNVYSSCGKLEEAASVVRILRQKGLKMLPACTWVDIRKQSFVFYSGNDSLALMKKIYQKLNVLLLDISNHGYIPETRFMLPDVDKKEEQIPLYHSEKLAVAFGLLRTLEYTPLQLMQSHRICNDCHNAIKLIAKVSGREITMRDASRFHHFKDGKCSCGDYW